MLARHSSIWVLVITVSLLGCAAPPEDSESFCKYEQTPEENATVIVDGNTDVYYYLLDATGKQLQYAKLNNPLAINPEKYLLKVNNAIHSITVKPGHRCRCATNTIEVKGTTTDIYYYILDTLREQLSYAHLNEKLSLFPGKYVLKVNNTQQTFTLSLDKPLEVNSGNIVTNGTTDAYYYVLDQTGDQLHYNKLNQESPLLAGQYLIKINNTILPAKIESGSTTPLNSGTVSVKGVTDEYYYVLDSAGSQLHYQKLNEASSLFPGNYVLKVNNSKLPIELTASAGEYETGSVVVNGNSDEYYYVLDMNGNQLAYTKQNQPLSLLAGEYTVKVKDKTRVVTVSISKQMAISF